MWPVSSGSSIRAGALLFLALLAPLAPAAAQAAGATTLTVEVRDSDGHALAGAQVQLLGLGLQALTDSTGRARLDRLGPGTVTVAVQRVGYAPERSTTILPMAGPVAVTVVLRAQPVNLAAVDVRAPAPLPLEGTGFYERRRMGAGTFATRAEIEAAHPRTLGDFLRSRVAGMSVSPGTPGTPRVSTRGNTAASCPVQFYLDGVQTFALDVDDVNVQDVEGLEIYRGASTVPARFNRGNARCGVILVWTRNGREE